MATRYDVDKSRATTITRPNHDNLQTKLRRPVSSHHPVRESTPPLPLEEGTLVDHFRVMRLLGQGGMAQVYLARDTRLGRKVALKIIRPTALGSQDGVERFLFEARATARFSHPHIVTVFAVGEHQGRPYVALEYLEGQTLKERIDESRPSEKQALRIGLAIAEALAEAHRGQILHRDLKPENVVIPRDGRLRVVDFGLAKVINSAPRDSATEEISQLDATAVADELEQTATQDIFISHDQGLRGTPLYMSPEQWLGEECTGATDIWALGLILFEMLTGRLPYSSPSAMKLAVKVCNPDPIPNLDSIASASPDVASVVARCLEKNPINRPTADEAVESIQALLDRQSQIHPEKNEDSPFRGLLPFSERHADFFFGRDLEIEAFLERLREEPVLPVVGPSGAGKSSFVQAGIIPRLREQGRWIILRLRPGATPFRTLATRLKSGESTLQDRTLPSITPMLDSAESLAESTERASREEDALAAQLLASPSLLNLMLHRLATQGQGRVLLFVDQLEELYTLVPNEEHRRAFMQALCTAADDHQEPVRVIMTLRDDFLGRLAEGSEVQEALSRLTVLRSPAPGALREILIKPLAAVGYHYDDPTLVDEMVNAVGGEAACLPLLQFVTRTLWESRDRQKRQLLRSVYEEVGGVAGALAYHADGVLEAMTDAQVTATRQILLQLVTPDGTRQSLKRSDVLADSPEQADDVIDKLIQARLLSVRKSRGDDRSDIVLEIAHESLIRSWTRLARWIDESREELTFLAEVEQAAVLWERRGRRNDELWSDDALRDALRQLEHLESRASDTAIAFLESGRSEQLRREKQTRRRRLAWTAGLVGVTLLSIFVAFGFAEQKRRAVEQREQARLRWAEVERQGSRSALEQERMLESRSRLRAALEVHDTTLARALWWRQSIEPLLWSKTLPAATYDVAIAPDGEQFAVACQDKAIHIYDMKTAMSRVLRGANDQVFSVAFSPKGKRIAAGTWSGRIKIWNLEDGSTTTLEGHEDQVWVLAFAPDGQKLASASYDRTVRVWDLSEDSPPRIARKHRGPIQGLSFSPNGEKIATVAYDGALCLWQAPFDADPDCRQIPMSNDVSFSPDGKSIAITGIDRRLRTLDAQESTEQEVIEGVENDTYVLSYLPNSKMIATGGQDGSVLLWDLAKNSLSASFPGHDDGVHGIAVTPDGERIISVSYDGVVKVWDANALDQRPSLSGHEAATRLAVFAPDGETLASAGGDNTIRIWNVEDGSVLKILKGHSQGVNAIAYSPNGSRLVSSSSDKTIRLWKVSTGEQLRVIAAHESTVNGVTFNHAGTLIASCSQDQTIMTWNALSGTAVKGIFGHGEGIQHVTFTEDDSAIIAASHDSTVRRWDLETGLAQWVFGDHAGPVWGVATNPVEKNLIVSGGQDGTIRLFDQLEKTSRILGRHKGRVYWVSFAPSGDVVASASSDETARLWSLDGSPPIVLRGHRTEVNSAAFSPDGALLVTSSDDGTIRTWDAKTGHPYWRAPFLDLSRTPPRLLTHLGWESFSGDVEAIDATKNWERAVFDQARTASISPDGQLLCLRTHGDAVELWSTSDDHRLARQELDDIRALIATDRGCYSLAGGDVRFHSPAGKTRDLASRISAINLDETQSSKLFILSDDTVELIDTDGETMLELEVGAGVKTAVSTRDHHAIGFIDGSIELRERRTGERPELQFEGTPSSPIERMLRGPRETLIVGYSNGLVGIWDLETGFSLWQQRLHGAVVHLERVGSSLYIATDLGEHRQLDLALLDTERCELLRQVWQRVPTIWSGSRAVITPPPRGHECNTISKAP